MISGIFALFLLSVSKAQNSSYGNFDVMTPYLMHIDRLPNVAHFDDAQNRGPAWYDYSERSEEAASDLDSGISSESYGTDAKDDFYSPISSEASSKDTKEKKKATAMHRACTPCPHDMMKNFKNLGIKWICGGYQRARRSFKSECMMRFRNCQDGTMFVKLSNHKCGTSSGNPGNATLAWHGKHWFYDYRA